MSKTNLYKEIDSLITAIATLANFSSVVVCTDGGLLVASTGEGADPDQLAALTSLFDDIVTRSCRDLELDLVDEVTMLDPKWGRLVVRPLNLEGETRFFVVVRVKPRATWRANTNTLMKRLRALLIPLQAGE